MSPISLAIGVRFVAMQRVTGHVFRVERKRGPVCYAGYRLPSGRQVQKLIGLAWSEREMLERWKGRSTSGTAASRSPW
jgi:hypothetical protein